MPIYEYECQSCHRPFELLIRGDEQPVCPLCDGADVEKQLSVTAAPGKSGGDLPVAGSNEGGGCGRPRCGGGHCAGLDGF